MNRGVRGGDHRPAATAAGARRVTGRALGSGAGLAVSAVTARLLGAVALDGSRPAAPRPDELVLATLAGFGAALAVWLAVGCVLALTALVPGAIGRTAAVLAERVTPAALRRLLTLVLGASVGSMALPPTLLSSAGTSPLPTTGAWSAAAHPAGATPHPAGATPHPVYGPTPGYSPTTLPGGSPSAPLPPAAAGPDLAGPGFVPTPPAPVHDAEGATLLARPPRPTAAAHGLVTVRRGDTLWSIARRHLGPGASDAEVARAWPRWYAANQAVIGDDPDRILAGQQLVPPDARGVAPARTKE